VIVEPLMRSIKPRPGFLEALRECTRECDVLLIFDEVVTGFRLAWGGAQELYGVVPDIAALGKIVGGGFPIGALVGSEEIMSRLDPAFRAQGQFALGSGTFSANPLSATAGLAALQEMERPGTYDRLNRAGARLREGFARVCQMLEVPALVVNEGPIVDVMMTEEEEVVDYRSSLSRDRDLETRVGNEMIKRGIFAPAGHKIYVSLAHSDEDLDRTVDVFETALRLAR
jgi:glutamate-1-semialdehyde 2,1-aminomutase